MRIIFIALLILSLFTNISYAELYAVVKGITPEGVVYTKDPSSWQGFKMYLVGEEFQGKEAYQITYENNSVRLATPQEVVANLAVLEQEKKNTWKAKILYDIGLNDADIQKIKNLP